MTDCRALETGVYNFPAMCRLERGHKGPHQQTWWMAGSTVRYVHEWANEAEQ